VKGEEFFDQASNYQHLTDDPAAWSFGITEMGIILFPVNEGS
jgi:hypothetical protein